MDRKKNSSLLCRESILDIYRSAQRENMFVKLARICAHSERIWQRSTENRQTRQTVETGKNAASRNVDMQVFFRVSTLVRLSKQ